MSPLPAIAIIRADAARDARMFTVTEEEAAAIRNAYLEGGELVAVAELRRRFPSFNGNPRARDTVRAIAGWQAAERQPSKG